MWLNATDYGPRDPSRAGVQGVRVPLALAVEDVSGDSAIMQYISGKLIVQHGPEYRVLSNDPPYDDALAELAKYNFTNATRDVPLPGNTNSLDRFIRANFYINFLRKTTPRTNRTSTSPDHADWSPLSSANIEG